MGFNAGYKVSITFINLETFQRSNTPPIHAFIRITAYKKKRILLNSEIITNNTTLWCIQWTSKYIDSRKRCYLYTNTCCIYTHYASVYVYHVANFSNGFRFSIHSLFCSTFYLHPMQRDLFFFFTEDSFVSMCGDKMHFLKSTFKFFALSSIIHTCHVMFNLSPLCIIHQHRRKGDMHLKKTVTF